jgi:hypothetical protein
MSSGTDPSSGFPYEAEAAAPGSAARSAGLDDKRHFRALARGRLALEWSFAWEAALRSARRPSAASSVVPALRSSVSRM